MDICNKSIAIDDFLHLANAHKLREVTGCYIITNECNDMIYVGQGKKVIDRLNAHFIGEGNQDVYQDYISGHEFTVEVLPLSGSGYDTLDEMERVLIRKYEAVETGYNQRYGNI